MIHTQTWSGSGSARVTDMTFAGKRGKTCQVLTVHGEGSRWIEPSRTEQRKAMDYTTEIHELIKSSAVESSFEEIQKQVTSVIDRARADGVGENWLSLESRTIRGVDAPKPKLVIDADGFSACADDDGITINDKRDLNNEPSMITRHDQAKNAAYAIAAKVWEKVKSAKTFSEAGNILSGAGAKLHYYCRVD